MEEGGKREFKARESGVSDPPVPLHMFLHNLQRPLTSRSYERTLVFAPSLVIHRFPHCQAIHLLRYIVVFARTLSTNSIPNYLNVVRLLQFQFGYPNTLEEPLFKHQKTVFLRGIKRINGTSISQKLPITPEVFYKIQAVLNLNSSIDGTFSV